MSDRCYIETALEELTVDGKRYLLKMECDQSTKSFKVRGMDHLIRYIKEQGRSSLVSSSGGNAGYSAAYVARELGMDIQVVVPESTSDGAKEMIRGLGAQVKVHGIDWPDADQHARALVEVMNAGYVHPFEHASLWEGHSSLVDEVAKVGPRPDVVVLAVGGGGLLSGTLLGMHRNYWQDVPVIACETEGAASLAACVETGKHIEIEHINTVASSLGARKIGDQAFSWLTRHEVISYVMSDEEALNACQRFEADMGRIVEPACGAALSVMYQDVFPQYENPLIIVCGGISGYSV